MHAGGRAKWQNSPSHPIFVPTDWQLEGRSPARAAVPLATEIFGFDAKKPMRRGRRRASMAHVGLKRVRTGQICSDTLWKILIPSGRLGFVSQGIRGDTYAVGKAAIDLGHADGRAFRRIFRSCRYPDRGTAVIAILRPPFAIPMPQRRPVGFPASPSSSSPSGTTG
jgi:hypothetical protein